MKHYTELRNLVKNNLDKEIVIVCIGTDRSTGDSLGPLTGTLLSEKKLKNIKIYGTLEYPIHAVNLEEQMALIKWLHPDAFIIGVDASLGKIKNIGKIRINDGPLKPGAGVGKDLMPVGDCSITAIVNVGGHMEFFVLQNTRLNLVMGLAKELSSMIEKLDKYISNRNKKLERAI